MILTKYDFNTMNGIGIPRPNEIISDELAKIMIAEFHAGVTVREMCVSHRRTGPTIREMLAKAGIVVPVKPRGQIYRKPVDETLLVKLYTEGLTTVEIKKKFGIAHERMRDILQDNNVAVRTQADVIRMKRSA